MNPETPEKDTTAAPTYPAAKQFLSPTQEHLPPQKRHLAQICMWYPDLLKGKILDLGSGPGSFLIQAAEVGADVVGIEPSQELIDVSLARAQSIGLAINVQKGTGEHLPFPDQTFGFVNMAEVIEHVEDPSRVLREVFRVLQPKGGVYMSVPNRFGIYDPHYHAYFVNWLPRPLATPFLKLIGKNKDDSVHALNSGRQHLEDMHYYTLSGISSLCHSLGFTIIDIREAKIDAMHLSPARRLTYHVLYKIARPFYFDTFHIGLIKR